MSNETEQKKTEQTAPAALSKEALEQVSGGFENHYKNPDPCHSTPAKQVKLPD